MAVQTIETCSLTIQTSEFLPTERRSLPLIFSSTPVLTFAIGLQITEFSLSSRSNLPLKTYPQALSTFAFMFQIDDINTSDRRDAFAAQGIYGETPTGGSGQFWS